MNDDRSPKGPLPQPPPMPPGALDIPFNQMPSNKKQFPQWEDTYKKCLQKGKERAAKMGQPKQPPKEGQPDKQQIFEKDYVTVEIDHKDSPTNKALLSTWKHRKTEDEGYKNTPGPQEGRILSWQNKRDEGEPLQNSDIYFYQYQQVRKGLKEKAPPLQLLRRQQARAEETEKVYNYMGFQANTPSISGVWNLEEDGFYALLGTQNGSGPAFLVIDHGEELGITGIEKIELTPTWDTIYYFRSK